MDARIVIIDDEDLFREDLATLLRREGYDCRTAPDGDAGLALCEQFKPHVILCDIVMPGRDGVEILGEIMTMSPQSCVIMITAYGALETAVEAFRRGAADYIIKPLLIEDVIQKIGRLVNYTRLGQEVKLLRREVSRDVESLSMVGRSDAMKKVFELIRQVAPTKSTVLVTGQSGTGKELVTRAIHATSESSDGPFVAVNCASIPDNLVESELFGHVRGAFTGAVSDRRGFFELAGEGTLFLDEIAEMPLAMQGKMLRALEEREFFPVGGDLAVPLSARIITSTNKDLLSLTKSGDFREDLFFRIAVFEIPVPTLGQRRSDIPLFVEHFVQRFNGELKRKFLCADNDAMRALLAYSWPGNVRQLRNVVERAMIIGKGDYIQLDDLPAEVRGDLPASQHSDDLRDAMREYETVHIRRVLAASGGNKEEASRRLGVNPSTLYRKMAELNLADPAPRTQSGDDCDD